MNNLSQSSSGDSDNEDDLDFLDRIGSSLEANPVIDLKQKQSKQFLTHQRLKKFKDQHVVNIKKHLETPGPTKLITKKLLIKKSQIKKCHKELKNQIIDNEVNKLQEIP